MTRISTQQINFGRIWKYRHEPIYRHLDKKEYLDDFFKDDLIQLSCVAKFKQYPAESHGDKKEGSSMLFADTTEDKTIGMYYTSGYNAYILSTSKNIDKETINSFNSVGCIKIINSTAFAAEISNRIPRFLQGVEGNCLYVDKRTLKRKLDPTQTKKYSVQEMQVLENQFKLLNELCDNDELFIKEMDYREEDEYRLIWFTGSNVTDSLLVQCPEAIQYCERIDF